MQACQYPSILKSEPGFPGWPGPGLGSQGPEICQPASQPVSASDGSTREDGIGICVAFGHPKEVNRERAQRARAAKPRSPVRQHRCPAYTFGAVASIDRMQKETPDTTLG